MCLISSAAVAVIWRPKKLVVAMLQVSTLASVREVRPFIINGDKDNEEAEGN